MRHAVIVLAALLVARPAAATADIDPSASLNVVQRWIYNYRAKPGSDSLPMIFAGDLGSPMGESTPCELAFKFRHLCLVDWRLTA